MPSPLVSTLSGALLLLGHFPNVVAELDISSSDSIKESSRSLAKDLMTFYKGDEPGQTPGILPWSSEDINKYWWYLSSSFFATYLDYWHLTGDDSYAATVSKALQFQVGPENDYMPPNQTATLGNEDQCFWGTAALMAAEYGFPEVDGKAKWIDLAKNVWTTQASPDRYDETCNGGLRWQIPFSNNGYEWKHTASNACFFNLGARLARFTGNTTYSDYSDKRWDWLTGVGFVDTSNWKVYDGALAESNCTQIGKAQWSYTPAMLIQGAAFMYNNTNGSEIWRDRAVGLSDALLKDFFPEGVIFESACEPAEGRCPTDALFYKGYVHRWLSSATQLAPFLADTWLPVLKTSAEAAVKQCEPGNSGINNRCGFYWTSGKFVDPMTADNTTGIGEGLSVLAAVSNLLIKDAKAPIVDAARSGGSSGNSPSGTTGGSSPTSTTSTTATPGSGAGQLGMDFKVSFLLPSFMLLAWHL
ncbi:glycoside hydrolase family 76 [Colletotrichum scovillei]|uniref:glycoside hydrolase family 76 n=1 Tax=Colletotrichum scovillei TaxID=1209932 RepID=UPI0015C2EE54|nr:glycoside hydrolase family 76 [Colletotrichum scovillei]KAF4777847.1 glycoside hydrolase family 76 [Colletotrichum scovillei]KAG7085078.1 glycoside hydrolase family 76 [Colletotrichum scovillei]